MSSSREKVGKIMQLVADNLDLKGIEAVIKIDVKSEVSKKLAAMDDAKLDALIEGIKKIVNEA